MMLLMGGTGLLGGQVIRRLREQKVQFRLYTRGSRNWSESSVHGIRQKGIEVIIADACDRNRLLRAAEGCTAIINLTGEMPPKVGTDFEALHVTVAENVLSVAEEHEIQRVIHVSCLGATDDSQSEYLQTKFEGEELIRQAELYWTVFRPSYIFADDIFPFVDLLMPLIKFKLFMPILGDGQNVMRPVHADDVAECIVKAIFDKGTVSKTFEIAGAEEISMQQLMLTIRKQLGLGGATMNIPTQTAAKATAALNKIIPKSPISPEFVQLLLSNSTTTD
ncbi:MAG: NAD(P)H-binding protein, partial [Terriglobales bacterium]